MTLSATPDLGCGVSSDISCRRVADLSSRVEAGARLDKRRLAVSGRRQPGSSSNHRQKDRTGSRGRSATREGADDLGQIVADEDLIFLEVAKPDVIIAIRLGQERIKIGEPNPNRRCVRVLSRLDFRVREHAKRATAMENPPHPPCGSFGDFAAKSSREPAFSGEAVRDTSPTPPFLESGVAFMIGRKPAPT